MNENKKRFVASALSLIFAMSFLTTNVFAASSGSAMGEPPGDPPGGSAMGEPPGDPPDGAGGQGGPGGGSSASVSYTGASTIDASTTQSDPSYTSSTGGENSLLVSGGESTLTNITVTKSGDESDENSDFYGTNAAVLVYNGATLNIEGGSVTTDGAHANGVFAYGTGTVNISNVTITHKGGMHRVNAPRDNREKSEPNAMMWGTLPAQGIFVKYAENVNTDGVSIRAKKTDKRPAIYRVNVK